MGDKIKLDFNVFKFDLIKMNAKIKSHTSIIFNRTSVFEWFKTALLFHWQSKVKAFNVIGPIWVYFSYGLEFSNRICARRWWSGQRWNRLPNRIGLWTRQKTIAESKVFLEKPRKRYVNDERSLGDGVGRIGSMVQ